MPTERGAGTAIRDLGKADLPGVVRIDALQTGSRKPAHWSRVFEDLFAAKGGASSVGASKGGPVRIGLAAEEEGEDGIVGYLLGDVRAFEFGSEACGWVFAVAVRPDLARGGVATALLEEACSRFRRAGVDNVRTMVRRNDVPVLSFFRARGFQGGPFVQLERNLSGA